MKISAFCFRRFFVGVALLSLGGFALAASIAPGISGGKQDLTLRYYKPATQWLEALPLGNGRMGAMVLGGIKEERLILNEGTLYAEEPGGRDSSVDITKDFEVVMGMIRREEYIEADDYITRHWLGRSMPCYQPLADVVLQFDGPAEATDYLRTLDLSDAIARVRFQQGGIHFEREVFASNPRDAVIVRLRADKAGALNFQLNLTAQHPTAKLTRSGGKEITFTGQLPGIALRRTLEFVEGRNEQAKYPELWNADGSRKPFAKQILYGDEVNGRGMRFEVRVRVLQTDGKVTSSDQGLEVAGAQ